MKPIFLIICLFISSSLAAPNLQFSTSVRKLINGRRFQANCSVKNYQLPAGRLFTVYFMRSAGSVAAYHFKPPEVGMPPELYFISTQLEDLETTASPSKFPDFQIWINPKSAKSFDTYWCEYSEGSNLQLVSNKWEANSAVATSGSFCVFLLGLLVSLTFYVF